MKKCQKYKIDFFQILEFQGNEVCFWYSFYHWSIVVLSITLNFSKIGPTSGHNLEMGAWSQKLVIILYLVIVLWPNGTYGKAGDIFIRKLKFSTEFGKVGKNEVKSPSVLTHQQYSHLIEPKETQRNPIFQHTHTGRFDLIFSDFSKFSTNF